MSIVKIDMEKYEFRQDASWRRRLDYYWDVALSSFGGSPLPGPVVPKHTNKWDDQSYEAFLASIFVNDLFLMDALRYHRSHFKWWQGVTSVSYLLGVLVLLPIVLMLFNVIVPLAVKLAFNISLLTPLIILIGSALAYGFMLISFGIAFRLAVLLSDRYFAESVCVVAIVPLLVELSHDDVLQHSDRRKLLQARVNYLSQRTLLLALRYASRGEHTQERIREHFKRMETYIREREGWIITPKENTLKDLRKDFYELSKVYISGNYGTFDWQAVETVAQSPVLPPSGRVQRAANWVLRLFGMALPLIVLGFFLLNPERLEVLRLDPNIVALIFVAWLMLAIDAVLELGVVANVLGLAKQIKDLK